MSWLHIIQDTTYRYKKAVRFGPHRLVLRPREGHDVRIEQIRVEIEPEFELEWSRDLFGNCVATAHILDWLRSHVGRRNLRPPHRSRCQQSPTRGHARERHIL